MVTVNTRTTQRGGGPATASGKTKSSLNAVQHGLRGVHPANLFEQMAMARKLAELNDHYQPQSPLASLQIERIARCAVKLETLYAVEQAKSDLALWLAPTTDAQVIEQFSNYPASARVLALQLQQPIKPQPPLGLTDRLLDRICREIDAFVGPVRSDSEFAHAYPKLCKFLQTSAAGHVSPMSLDHRLGVVARLLHAITSASALPSNSSEPTAKASQVDDILAKINSEHTIANPANSSCSPTPGQLYQAAIKADLSAFKQLRHTRQLACEITAQLPRVKSLLVAATAMPSDDSDRLMRYQTALEKQLSRYMGELLQLLPLKSV